MSENLTEGTIDQLKEFLASLKKDNKEIQTAFKELNQKIDTAQSKLKTLRANYKKSIEKHFGDTKSKKTDTGPFKEEEYNAKKATWAQDTEFTQIKTKYKNDIENFWKENRQYIGTELFKTVFDVINVKTGNSFSAFDASFSNLDQLLEAIKSFEDSDKIHTELQNAKNRLNGLAKSFNLDVSSVNASINQLEKLRKESAQSSARVDASINDFNKTQEEANKKFKTEIESAVKTFKSNIEDQKKQDDSFVEYMSTLTLGLKKQMKEIQDANLDSMAAKEFKAEDEIREAMRNALTMKYKDKNYNIDVLADALMKHAGRRGEIQKETEQTITSLEDFKKSVMKDDKFSGRLLKMLEWRKQGKGSIASIKDDIRRDFTKWTYGGPHTLGGYVRAKLGTMVLNAFTNRKLKKLDQEGKDTDTLHAREMEEQVAKKLEKLQKVKSTLDKKVKKLADSKVSLQLREENFKNLTDDGAKQKEAKVIAAYKKTIEDLENKEIPDLKKEFDEVKEQTGSFISSYEYSKKGTSASDKASSNESAATTTQNEQKAVEASVEASVDQKTGDSSSSKKVEYFDPDQYKTKYESCDSPRKKYELILNTDFGNVAPPPSEKKEEGEGGEQKQTLNQIPAESEEKKPETITQEVEGKAEGEYKVRRGDVFAVGEAGPEGMIFNPDGTLTVAKIKSTSKSPVSIGLPSLGGGAGEGSKMKSSAEFELEQQKAEDEHKTASGIETLVELQIEANKKLDRIENDGKEKKKGGLLSMLIGLYKFFKGGGLIKGLAALFKGGLLKNVFKLFKGGMIGNVLKFLPKLLPMLGSALPIIAAVAAGGFALFKGIQGWNDKKTQDAVFGKKDKHLASEKMKTAQGNIVAGFSNILSWAVSFFSEDLAKKIKISPEMATKFMDALCHPVESLFKLFGWDEFLDKHPFLKKIVNAADGALGFILNPISKLLEGFEGMSKAWDDFTKWWEEHNPITKMKNWFNDLGRKWDEFKISDLIFGRKKDEESKGASEEKKPEERPSWMPSWVPYPLAEGGFVKANKHGHIAIIGEGGEDEAVMPMSKLARFALESHDLLKNQNKEDPHHKSSGAGGGMWNALKKFFGFGKKSKDEVNYFETFQTLLTDIKKGIESIEKMVGFIKVDGVTLKDMLDHKPMDMRGAQIPPGAGQAGAQIGAAVNQMPGGGQSWGAAPALGGPMQALDLPASGAFSGGKAENLNASKQQIANLVIAEAKRQGVDPRLALAIARQESNFNQNDISRAGAVGVMQIMPADVNDYGGGNVYNLNDNIRIGVTEIKKKLQLANGDVREALLRYNWGDGNVRSYKRRGTGNRGQQIPKEAREYADRVLGHIQRGTVANIMKASPGGEAAAMQGAQTINPAGSPYTPAQQAEINANPMFQGVPQQGYPQQQGSTPSITRLLNIASRNAKNALGYSQNQTKRMSTHFDCSSFVGRSLQEAGFKIPGNLTTDKMNPNDKNVMSNEFTWIPGLKGMQPGDVMWRKGHTEIYIGNGQTIGALNGDVSRDKQVGVHPLDWGKFVGYWHPKPGAGQQGNQNDESMKQVPQQAPASGPIQQNQQPESVPLYNPETGEQIKEPASPAPGGAPAPAGGGMQQIPAQQSPAIPGMPNMKGGPVQGLSSLYANMTRDAISRHVTYGWNSKNSRSGSIDCSGWVTEMNKMALGGLSGQARTNMETIIRGGQQGGAAGLIQAGESLGFGVNGGLLDPRLGKVKENMMIGLSIGKHAKGRHKGIGHIVQTYRDPATGELMVSESTSKSRIGGRSGVITTKYSDWYEKYKSAGLHAVDLDAATGGAFAGGNIQGAMQGVQQPDMGQLGGQTAGPQIQGSPQAQAQQAATAYYESGGGGGGNVYAPTTNVMGGGGNADKGGATFLTTKDPMSWIILQGNTVH